MTMHEALEHALVTGTPLLVRHHGTELMVYTYARGQSAIEGVMGNFNLAWDDTWFPFEHNNGYTLLDWFDMPGAVGNHQCYCERHDLMIRGCVCGGK